MTPNPQESRRAQRKPVNLAAQVTDAISGQHMGQLGNLSASGMLLIGSEAPRNEAIYQLRLPLPGLAETPPTIEVGVQEQWHEEAATPGQVWAGYRIIAIGEAEAEQLQRWLDMPG
ncbi:PilZ domain-containing protein [Frateuria hangzhouensis]|uniref:PilZ domain-containing protein n=1 Tax=Frateuria hangzhouensis TaxID=2995589 RepID=UPI002260C8FF|nr:PilZ domain-containing protein [Frateuria sp. STR12]MCX7515105.1 PilZ domain-containing protein [Frateuria sp. STR12]